MKKLFLLLLVCLCTFCSKKKAQNPRDLYSMEQVAVFLKDLYLLETKVKDLRLSKDSSQVIFDYYEAELYKEHNMDSALYKKSFKYYMSDVQGMTKIYEIIADSLSLEERIMQSEMEEYE